MRMSRSSWLWNCPRVCYKARMQDQHLYSRADLYSSQESNHLYKRIPPINPATNGYSRFGRPTSSVNQPRHASFMLPNPRKLGLRISTWQARHPECPKKRLEFWFWSCSAVCKFIPPTNPSKINQRVWFGRASEKKIASLIPPQLAYNLVLPNPQ